MSVDVLPLNPSTVLVDENHAVLLLHAFGKKTPHMSVGKVAELWREFSKHEMLFADTIKDDPEAFLDTLMNPRAVWFEICSLEDSKPIGVAAVTNVIPGFDAQGHFAFWDSQSRGREDLIMKLIVQVMEQYQLHRISAEIPSMQSGVIRFIKRLGFQSEGVRREGTLRKGSWIDMEMFGILQSEAEEALNGTR